MRSWLAHLASLARHNSRLVRFGLLIAFLISFFIPAVGDPGRPASTVPGFGALVGAIQCLFLPLSGELGLRFVGLSVLANAFFAWAWLVISTDVAVRKGEQQLLRVLGSLSLVLSLLPILLVDRDRLLIGYWLWIAAIAGIVAVSWSVRKHG